MIIAGSLEVKLPTIWTDGKTEAGRVREEKRRREKIREKKSEKKKDACGRKGRTVANHRVFPMICGFGWSKSRLAKAAGAEPAGRMRNEKLHVVEQMEVKKLKTVTSEPLSEVELSNLSIKCTLLWCQAHLEAKMYKARYVWTTFES